MSKIVNTEALALRIKRARERSNISSQRKLARMAGMPQARWSRIENNNIDELWISDLAKIASVLDVKMATLLYGSPIRDQVMTAARATEDSEVSIGIDQVIDRVEVIAEIRESQPTSASGITTSPRKPHQSPEDWGREQAERLRNEANKVSGPIEDLDTFIEDVTKNTAVLYLPLPDGVDGLYVNAAEENVAVFAINTSIDFERQRFTLAHELAHLLAGDNYELLQEGSSPSESETAAHAFARHLLLPINDLDRGPWDKEHLSKVVCDYRISPYAAAIQLKRAKIISEAELIELKELTSRGAAALQGLVTQRTAWEKEANTPRLSPRATREAIRAWQDRIIGIRSLAKLLAAPAAQLASDLEADDIVRKEEPTVESRPVNLDELLAI